MNAKRSDAIVSLMYVVRSLLALPEARRRQAVGVGAQPWCELLDQITQKKLGQDLRPVVVPLMAELCRHSDHLTVEQLTLVGAAARRLLKFAWGQTRRDSGMVRVGIEGVCRSFETAPSESTAVLQKIIDPGHMVAFGFEELPTLARELKRPGRFDAKFVEAVFRACLAYDEEDDSPTPLGGESAIMPLSSNKRQDYRLALHSLGEAFPEFMANSPVEATGAVIAGVEAKTAEVAIVPLEEIVGEVIRVGNVEARFAEDGSHVWDAGNRHRHDLHLELLNAFEQELVRLAGNGGNQGELARLIERVVNENRFAAVWRRLLSAGAREPNGLGIHIWTLAKAHPVLLSADTLEPMGRFLTRVFPLLGPKEREGVEGAILSLGATKPDDEGFYARRRDRLLGCLPLSDIVSEAARTRLRELQSGGGPPPNTPPFEILESDRGGFSEEHWLAEQGVNIEAPANKELMALMKPVRAFRSAFLNAAPPQEDVTAVFADLKTLHESLLSDGQCADGKLISDGWISLSAAVEVITRAGWLGSNTEMSSFVRSVLLGAAKHELPRVTSERNEHFEEHGSSHESPRWYASGGLLNLARYPSLADSEVIEAVRRLAEDDCAEVRAEVAHHLGGLYRNASELFWQLLKRVESAEESRRIVQIALCGVQPIGKKHRDQLRPIAHTVFARFLDDEKGSSVRSACLSIVLNADVAENKPYGDDLVDIVMNEPLRFTDESIFLIQRAAEHLTQGSLDPPDAMLDRLRTSSFQLLERMAANLKMRIRELENRMKEITAGQLPGEVRTQVECIRRLAHELGQRLYFASGSFDEKMTGQNQNREPKSEDVKRRFLRDAAPLIDQLAEIGFPDVVHSCLEMLAEYVGFDPQSVFLKTGLLVRHGQAHGYQFESLGASVVVGLVKRYLADYRVMLREDAACRDTLTEILNTFVRAGWPEALNLTYRLEEIFR